MQLQSKEAKKEKQHDGRWSSWSFCLRREFHCKKIGLSICDVSIHTYAKECKKNASRECKEGQRVWGWVVGAKGFECCCPFSTVFFFFVHIVRKKMSFIKQRWDVLLSREKNSTQQRFNCEHSQAAAAAVAAHILGFLPLLHGKETDSPQASKQSSPSWALRGQHRQWWASRRKPWRRRRYPIEHLWEYRS